MHLTELRRLVAQGEGLNLEFKRKARHPDKLARELVAFANTAGGLLLVGVDDDRTVYGCKFADEDAFVLDAFISKYCVPRLPLRLTRIPVSAQREVLAYEVKASRRRPHFLLDPLNPGQKSAFIRVADMSITASREMVQLLRHQQRKQGVSISVGDPERLLLRHLEAVPHITFDQARDLLRLSRRHVSETLVLLVRAGVLTIHPSEKGDLFRLSADLAA
jgi:predicted HTH transcriptional regulator